MKMLSGLFEKLLGTPTTGFFPFPSLVDMEV